MRVKYFKPEYLTTFKFAPPIIPTGQLVAAYMPVDRTGKFNPLDMMYEPIPITKKFNKTFEGMCFDDGVCVGFK